MPVALEACAKPCTLVRVLVLVRVLAPRHSTIEQRNNDNEHEHRPAA
jgi:hypothetical protein